MPHYSRTSDPNVVSVLERGDIFFGIRKEYVNEEWKEREFRYKVLYPGVLFSHSGNWVLRCQGCFKDGRIKNISLIEHIVINSQCIHKYKFNLGHILAARSVKKSELNIKGPRPIEEQLLDLKREGVTPSQAHLSQLTELLKPKPKKKLSEMKVKLCKPNED